MAQHELLVKLGLQSDSFSRNLRNVNNQLKLTDAEFKKLESSTKNFGSSQNDLEKKLNSMQKTKEQLTAKTVLYKNKIDETNAKIADATIKHDKLKIKLDEEKTKLLELEATTGKSSKAYKDQKKVVSDLQQEYDKSKKNLENYNLSLQKHKIELTKVETEINKLDRAIKSVSFQKMTLHLDQLSNKLIAVSQKLDVVSAKLGAAGRAMTAGITMPVVGAGTAVVKFGAEFESSMSDVQAKSRATSEDMVQLENKAREMGKATSFSAKEAADGLGYMALAGWKTKDMLVGIEPVLRLAEAGNMDLALTSDLVTDSMSSLGLKAGDLQGYLDKVARASTISNTSAEQMLRTYNQVGGTFQRFNVPLEESGALIGVLASRGMKAEQAGRALSSIMVNLTNNSGQAGKAMKDLGLSAYDSEGKFKGMETVLRELHGELYKVENGTAKYTEQQRNMYLQMIGGKTQIRTLDALLNGVAKTTENGRTEFENYVEELKNCDGALNEMAKTMKDNLKGDWEKFTSMVGELALTISDLLMPAMRDIVQRMTEMIEKFISLDEDTQKFILKTALLAAAIGPLLLAFSGVAKILSIITGAVGGTIKMFLGFGKTLGEVTALVGSGSSIWGALCTTIAGFPAIVALAGAALAGIITILGENEMWLSKLQEKWGIFGMFVSGVCESLAGIVQFAIGNIIIGLGTLGKVIVKAVTLQWDEIDDVIREGGSKIAQNTNKAFDNMTMSSTAAIQKMRNMNKSELSGLVDDMQYILEELPDIAFDNAERTARKFSEQFKNLSNDSIAIMSSTSDTMNLLFRGIHENMSNEEATAQYTKNLESMARTGGVSTDKLKNEIQKTLDLINYNMVDSGERFVRDAESTMEKFALVSSQGVDKAAGDIANHLINLSTNSIQTLQGMGNQWGLVFNGIKLDGTQSTADMATMIENNILRMAEKNPNYIKNLQEEMKTYFDKMPPDAEGNMLALKSVVEEGVQGAVDATEGKGDLIEENLEFDASTPTQEELNNVKQTFDSYGDPIEQSATTTAGKAEAGWTEGLEGMDEATINKMLDQANNISSSGDGSVEAMANNAVGSIDGFVSTWDANSGRINESVNATFENINRLTLLKWGNTTNGLSEVNKWLTAVSSKAKTTLAAMTPLTNLKWGNTTKGLSQVNMWLGNVTSKSNATKAAMTPLTAMKWGNTTKGLSEVVKWLGNVTTSSKKTEAALKAIIAVTYGSVTKGLSEVNRWLGNVRSSGNSAKSTLQSLANVKFGGLTSSLSQVNNWLKTVAKTASSTRSALSAVSAARASVPRSIQLTEEDKISILKPENMNLGPYSVNNGYLNQRNAISSGLGAIYKQSKTAADEAVNSTLMNALMKQNELLMQILTTDRDIVIQNDLILDGKKLARSTARHTDNELRNMEARKNRLGGVF